MLLCYLKFQKTQIVLKLRLKCISRAWRIIHYQDVIKPQNRLMIQQICETLGQIGLQPNEIGLSDVTAMVTNQNWKFAIIKIEKKNGEKDHTGK